MLRVRHQGHDGKLVTEDQDRTGTDERRVCRTAEELPARVWSRFEGETDRNRMGTEDVHQNAKYQYYADRLERLEAEENQEAVGDVDVKKRSEMDLKSDKDRKETSQDTLSEAVSHINLNESTNTCSKRLRSCTEEENEATVKDPLFKRLRSETEKKEKMSERDKMVM